LIIRNVIWLVLLIVVAVNTATAQSVAIGTDTPHPSAALDVTSTNRGAIFPRVSLVDVSNGLTPINSPATGLLVYNTNAAVVNGDGEGYYYWDGTISMWVKLLTNATRIVESYAVNATRTTINSTTFIPVTGLSQSITLTGNAMVIITTSGSMETFSTLWDGSGCIVQVFRNGVAIPNAFQTVDINDSPGAVNTILPWSFTSFVNLTAGTHTFQVRARKYAFDNFYAGGNSTAPSPNEGTLALLVIYL
jgi:hypothetical protein